MGQIVIEDLKVYGYHGVYEQEKKEGQTFLVNAVLDTSFAEAARSDDLSNTVDYGNVCLYIKKFFTENRHDLLEKVVDDLAKELMLDFPGIDSLFLKITKPDAPIPMEFEAVGVTITKQWTKVAISFGSNMGEKESYLTAAMESLLVEPTIRNVTVSDFIETEPYGYTEQDKFLNGAAILETILSPQELLDLFHRIEDEAGREREIHWGPRTLDLDILLYGDQIMNSKNLIIPHIDMCNRTFVLEPLNQIAPGMVHPVRRRTIYDLYHVLLDKEDKRGE